jgi:hypothetical protein
LHNGGIIRPIQKDCKGILRRLKATAITLMEDTPVHPHRCGRNMPGDLAGGGGKKRVEYKEKDRGNMIKIVIYS